MRIADRPGFSLLEAVVALAIVGIVAVGILGAFGSDLRGAETARTALTTSALARSRLARLEIADARELAALPDSLARGTFGAPFGQFAWAATSRAVDGEPDLYEVRVDIRGPSYQSDLRSRVFRPLPAVPMRAP